MAKQIVVGTGPAMKLSGLDWLTFKNAVAKRHLTEVPPSTAAHDRDWSEQPFAVLLFFQCLLQTDASSPYAGALADQFAKAMRDAPDAAELGVFTLQRPNRKKKFVICEHSPRDATRVFTIPAAEYRNRARELLQKYAQTRP